MATQSTRRDKTDRTPAFALTADQIAICHAQAALGWLDATLEAMHTAHCYKHRPILGFANSLNTKGDIAFSADWTAHRDENMAEAYAVWALANERLAA